MNTQGNKRLEAVVERLLPLDDDLTRRAGVAAYVAAALEGPIHGGNRTLIERGLDLVDGVAEDDFERSFTACDTAEQDAVLEQIADAEDRTVRHFFQTLTSLVLEGFLCDPSHGGNRDEIGWRFMGFGDSEPRPTDCLEEIET